MQKFDHKHFNLGKNIFSIYATINLCVEDLNIMEGESGADLDGVEEVGKALTWTQQLWRQAQRRSGCTTWTRRRSGRQSVRHRCGPGGGRWGTGMDPMAVEMMRCRGKHRGGVGALHCIDPTTVGVVVGEAPTWTWRRSVRPLRRYRIGAIKNQL
jgi:hypothetical protein